MRSSHAILIGGLLILGNGILLGRKDLGRRALITEKLHPHYRVKSNRAVTHTVPAAHTLHVDSIQPFQLVPHPQKRESSVLFRTVLKVTVFLCLQILDEVLDGVLLLLAGRVTEIQFLQLARRGVFVAIAGEAISLVALLLSLLEAVVLVVLGLWVGEGVLEMCLVLYIVEIQMFISLLSTTALIA